MIIWDRLMVQKTITEQRLLFDSEGLDQGDCLKEGHCAMTFSRGRAQTSLSSHGPHLYPDVLLTLYRTFCLVSRAPGSLFSRALCVADTLPLSLAHCCTLFISSEAQCVKYWVHCIRLFFGGDQIIPYLSHSGLLQECGDILARYVLETSSF